MISGPHWWDWLFSRRRRSRENDIERELRDHLDLEAEEQQGRGLDSEEARSAARRAFGNTTLVKEDVRTMWGWTSLDSIAQDLKYAGRLLLKNPGFTTVAILTLALGIGANTAIFTIVNSLMLKPLPYRDADRIVVPATIFRAAKSDRGSVSYPDILDWKAQTDLFQAVSTVNGSGFDVTGGQEPERIDGMVVDEDYFRVFTSPPLLGRTFTKQENMPGAGRVVVLTYRLWMRRFGGDRTVIGSKIEIGGVPHQIVGVMPENSTFPENVEIFRPLGFGSTPPAWTMRRDNHVFRAIARLQPGVTIQTAQAKLTAMGARIEKEAEHRQGTNWKIHPLSAWILGTELSRTLWILLGAVLVVLLIACVNVANLLLARGAARQREVAIRNALGAGWKRLAAQFLVESSVLALAGGVAGVALGYAGVQGLVLFAPAGVPKVQKIEMDLAVLGFTLALCVMTTLVLGLMPVFTTSRSAPVESFREGQRGVSGGTHATRVRSLLVVSELALAVLLLSGAGLLIRSFALLQRVDPGFPTENLITMQVGLPQSRYKEAQTSATFQQITEAIDRVNGVVSASATSSLPVGGGGFYLGRVFLEAGQPEPPASKDAPAQWSVIQPDYFETIRVPMVAGRPFSERDSKDSTPVIIINQSMAKLMFPNTNPIGRRIRSWRDENVYREIVGIVSDIRYFGLAGDIVTEVYVPHAQDSWNTLLLTVRTRGNPYDLMKSIRSEIWNIDKKLAISKVKTMDEVIAEELARPRFTMLLLGVFAMTAMVMAAVGIYGLVSYTVEQRTREIGIRMALGAVRWDILRTVTGRAFVLACSGVVLGLGASLAVAGVMKALLFGVSPTDGVTFATASAVLVFVALAASYIPARRAAKVDPITALRYE
jgi:putative ABC transport system permease protein